MINFIKINKVIQMLILFSLIQTKLKKRKKSNTCNKINNQYIKHLPSKGS